MLNLDTHILIQALQGSLTGKERQILSSDTWSISGIVLWEISKLVQLGRVEMDLAEPEVIRALSKVYTWLLTFDICRGIHDLDFRSDPADEIIASTSFVHRVPLVTRDSKIRKSKLVPLAR
jgi:PIN domain nuclease of toxin-antitoxin system